MKPVVIPIILLMSHLIMAQDSTLSKRIILDMKINNSSQGYFEYTDSSQGDKDALFVRGKQWVYKTYKSGDAVIQMDDKDAGLIECKGRTKVFRAKVGGFWHDVGGFEYKMSLRFKDGKYKCTIYDLTFVKAGDLWINEGADFSEKYPHN